MNAINKENVTQLTKSGVRELMEKKRKGIILQMLEIHKLNKKEMPPAQNSDKFRIIVSDGEAKVKCILGNKAAKIAEQYDLQPYSLIQLNENLFNNNENKTPIIIITDIEIVNTNINEEIGQPIDWTVYQTNGYSNPAGSNQIPTKFLKKAAVSPINNKPTNTLNNQTKSMNTAPQQQGGMNASKGTASNSLSNQMSKGNTLGLLNNGNTNDGIRDQSNFKTTGTVGTNRMGNTMTTTSNNAVSKNYQRSATFGNQNPVVGNNARNSMNNKPGGLNTPNKKLSELSIDDFTPISALVSFNSGFTIKAKITKKTDIRKYQKNETEGQVFSINILDSDGGEIQGSFFGDLAKEYHERLHEGRVYIFSGGTVKVANTKFQSVKNEYQIMFDKTTQIEETNDDGDIAVPSFDFIKLDQIEGMSVGTSIDLIALVKNLGQVTEVTLKRDNNANNYNNTTDTKARRVLEVYDSTLNTIELTLWGETAEKCAPKEGEVIIGRGLRVGEFLNKKNLSFSNALSQVFWGNTLPDIPQVQELMHWRDATDIGEGDFTQISKSLERPMRFCKTLDQVEEESANVGQFENERKFDWVKVHVSHIKTDDSMYYPACPTDKCMKKLNGDDTSGWKCYACNGNFSRASLRYTLSMKVEDGTNCIWVTAFSHEAEEILGAPAEKVKEIKDAGNDQMLADIVKEAMCHEWKMNISTKNDYYQGNSRVRYQVVRCIKMDFVRESKSCLRMLELYANNANV